jgi:hypothetical protein
MAFYTEERNIESWPHEAMVLNEFSKHGWFTTRPALAVAKEKKNRKYFKEKSDGTGTSPLSGKTYHIMVKKFTLLDNIPDNCVDPIQYLQTMDISSKSLSNQRFLGEEGKRNLPIDVIYERKFRDDSTADWDDEFIADFYRDRVFAIADSSVRYIFLVHGAKVRKYPAKAYHTGSSVDYWNYIPLTEVSKVWKSTDTEYIRDMPW